MVTVWQAALYCSKAIGVQSQPVKEKPANVSTAQIQKVVKVKENVWRFR